MSSLRFQDATEVFFNQSTSFSDVTKNIDEDGLCKQSNPLPMDTVDENLKRYHTAKDH